MSRGWSKLRSADRPTLAQPQVIGACTARQAALEGPTGEALDAIETYAAGGSGLRYDPVTDRYTYVWKTARTWQGCYQFQMWLAHGSLHTADFQFR
jgi:hypothetical protein